MNTFLSILLTIAMVVLSATAHAHPPEECRCGDETIEEIVVPFTQFRHEDVKFVYNTRFDRVSLRVRTHNVKVDDDSALMFLVKQVREIVAAGGNRFPLADTGYTVEFRSGHPLWGPTTLLSREGDYQELMFGERVELLGGVFIVHGSDTPPPYSWY